MILECSSLIIKWIAIQSLLFEELGLINLFNTCISEFSPFVLYIITFCLFELSVFLFLNRKCTKVNTYAYFC